MQYIYREKQDGQRAKPDSAATDAALLLSFIPPLPYKGFMKSHTLYKSPRKAVMAIVVCAALVAGIAAVMLLPEKRAPQALWLGAVFFGLGIPLGIHWLLDKRPWIVLDEEGVWDRGLRRPRIPWDAIEDAYVSGMYGRAMFVCLVLKEDRAAEFAPSAWVARSNRLVGTEPLNLNVAPTGVDADKLCMTVKLLAHLPREERANLLDMLAERKDTLK